MWELIQSNKRKSLILFLAMGIILLLLGYFIGGMFLGTNGGGELGIFFALLIWAVMSLVSYFAGSSIMLSVSRAKEVTKEVHPQLFNIVEEMKIASALPKIPKIFIINEEAPNAFATGRSPENCAVTVTAGLLSRLNRDELQGVIAHEMSHIKNRDILYMTFAGVMLGTIVIVSEVFLRGLWFGGGSLNRYKNRSSGGGSGQAVIAIAALVLAILAPILARLLYFAISRKREYLADASGVRLTRYPEGLASALEKLADNRLDLRAANKATAGMYIVNPLKKKGMKLSDLTSTHPPISERIRILRNMSQGAGYMDYQNAYMKIKNKTERLIPNSVLDSNEKVTIRDTSVSKETIDKKNYRRNLGDLVMNVNGYSFVHCVCGLTLKIPPTYKKSEIKCPRCGRINKVPPRNKL